MEDEVTKVSVSRVTIMVILNALADFVSTWNSHRIPGRRGGIPNLLARATSRVMYLSPGQIPSTTTAVLRHEQGSGNRLTRVSSFGRDPLSGHTGLEHLRYRDFRNQFPNVERIYQDILRGNPQLFKDAIQFFLLC